MWQGWKGWEDISTNLALCVCDAPIRYQPMLQQLISQLCYAKRRTIIQYRCAPDELKKWLGAAAVDSTLWISNMKWPCLICGMSSLLAHLHPSPPPPGKTYQQISLCVCVMHPFAISRCFSNWFHSYATPKGVPSSNTGVPQMNEKVIGRSCSWQHTLNLKHAYMLQWWIIHPVFSFRGC